MRMLVLMLVSFVALAGCQDLVDSFGESDKTPVAVRVIEASWGPGMEDDLEDLEGPDDALAVLIDTRFEYTHRGADVDPDAVQVSFLDEDGERRSTHLGKYTPTATLRDGDVVSITGVHMASDLTISRGGDVLFERAPVQRDWFTVGGVPLPMAAAPGSLATWSMEGSGGLSVQLEDGTFEADGERLDVRELLYDLSTNNTGSIDLRFAQDDLTFSGATTGDLALEMRVDATQSSADASHEVTGAFDGTGTWDLDGKAVLGFEEGELRSVGASGSVLADAAYDGHMTLDGERQELDDADVQHPLVDESFPLERHDVDLDNVEDPTIIDFFARLWAADIAVGDRLVVAFEQGDLRFDLEVEIAGADERALAGTTIATYRVLERVAYDAPGMEPISSEATYWIDQDSHLPVFAEIEESRTLDADALQELIGVTEVPLTLPDDLEIAYTSTATLRLEAHQEGLAIPGLLAMQGLRSGGMGAFGGAVGSPFGHPMGDTGASAPEVVFTRSETEDSITVVRADVDTAWWDLGLQATEPVAYALNGDPASEPTYVHPGSWQPIWDGAPVRGGDALSFCSSDGAASDVEVRVLHMASNTMLGAYSFTTLAAC